jgi:hypothetical protein
VKNFWLLVGACLAAAVLVRPLAPVFSRGYAVWSACPLTNADLRLARAADGSETASLVSPRLDPWGRPFHVSRSPYRTFVYSVGPDGVDDHGEGDDVVVAPIDTYTFVSWSPVYLTGAALLLLWAWFVFRLAKAPRSESLEKELLRAGGIATLPTAAGTALLVATVKDLSLFTPVPIRGVDVPPSFAVALCLGIVFFAVGLGLRHRASLPAEGETPGAPRRVRVGFLVVALALLPLYLAERVIEARVAAWGDDRLFLSAQLGDMESIEALVTGPDLERIRVLLRHPPPRFDLAVANGGYLTTLRRVGADAVPFMIPELARGDGFYGVSRIAWEHLLRFDPQLEQFARVTTEDATAYHWIYLFRADVIAARLGRRRVLEALAGLLRDTTPGPFAPVAGYRRRTCDLAATVFLRLAGDPPGLAVPDATKPSSIEDWARAIANVHGWWRAEARTPTLPPAGFVVVNAPELAPLPRQLGASVTLDGALAWRRTIETSALRALGPLTPGPHTVALDDGTGRKVFDGPVTVPPDGEAWIDVDFATGKVTVTTAQEK